ncbi:MAG: methylated-DNA--[protein]-cysteine S-methyltransferase [Gammaproteobacteria bacterium]|nr:methylated-DNA--[protein]-cysteine S-methyltransferase [Gammaproteobacteria bacterium]
MPAYQAVIDSPIPGIPSLGLTLVRGRLAGIDFLFRRQAPFVTTPAAAAVAALQRYLDGQVPQRPLLLHATGTPFQQRVWDELRRIPYGQVSTYGELACRLDSSARAVAGACRANPLPLLIPCHRVVAANGPGGYLGQSRGEAVEIKQWLLQHEGYA